MHGMKMGWGWSALVFAATMSTAVATSRDEGTVVVADRASGTLSLIDVSRDVVFRTIDLPRGDAAPEPMYVVPTRQRVFVGDRANDRVVVYRARDATLETTVPVGAGVFHMWASPRARQLWVVGDIDNTMTVIDPRSLRILATVPLPADLVADGGKPHDVIVSPEREHSAFVTVVGLSGTMDAVVKFDTRTFAEVARLEVGKDPHLSLTDRNRDLYVPSQDADVVQVLRRRDLSPVARLDVPGAHGAGMRSDGEVFYTTNLPGGGIDGLFAIDTRTNMVLGSVDTPFETPHNVALSKRGRKVYVTHSGATADQVSIYRTTRRDPVPTLLTTVTVGLNPFGIAYVPRRTR